MKQLQTIILAAILVVLSFWCGNLLNKPDVKTIIKEVYSEEMAKWSTEEVDKLLVQRAKQLNLTILNQEQINQLKNQIASSTPKIK